MMTILLYSLTNEFTWSSSEKKSSSLKSNTKLVGYTSSLNDKRFDNAKLMGFIHTETPKPKLLGHIVTPGKPAGRHSGIAGVDHRLSRNFRRDQRSWVRCGIKLRKVDIKTTVILNGRFDIYTCIWFQIKLQFSRLFLYDTTILYGWVHNLGEGSK